MTRIHPSRIFISVTLITTILLTGCSLASGDPAVNVDASRADDPQNTQTEIRSDSDKTNNDALSYEKLAAAMKTPLPIAGGKLPVGYWLECGADAVELLEYAVVDLDGDSDLETIIHYSKNKFGAWNDGYLIIHGTGDFARGYIYIYESTLILKADGTFLSKADESGAKIFQLKFDKHPTEELIAYSGSTDDGGTKFCIRDDFVSEEEFDAYLTELQKKPDAEWKEIPGDFPLTGDLEAESDDPVINGFDIKTIRNYPEFETAIRESVGKSTGDLTRRDFLSVMKLDLSGRGIRDLTPVKALVNLVELNASSNKITDVSPLSGLQSLYVLWLNNNDLDDISPISTLDNLATLGLDNNSGVDISPLANLKNLVNLSVRNCELTDISALTELNVTDLNLSGNNIDDIRPLGTLPKIERLKLNNNPITDLSALGNATTLLDLYVVNCPVEDFSPVAHVRRVEPYMSEE